MKRNVVVFWDINLIASFWSIIFIRTRWSVGGLASPYAGGCDHQKFPGISHPMC